MKPIAVFCTIGNKVDAKKMAKTVVDRGLAACAQLSQIESFYVWDGAVQNEPEVRIVFKTTDAQYQKLEETICKLHPYELPAIHAVDLDKVYEPYAAWVVENSSGKSG